MGALILFRPRPNRSHKRESPRPSSAEILFFTGVRYSRMVEATALADETPGPPPAEGVGATRRGRKPRRG